MTTVTEPGSCRSTQSSTTRPSSAGTHGPKNKKGPVKCFRCGIEGHISRDCPYRQPKSDEHEASGGRRVGSMALQEREGETTTACQKEIEELRRRFLQAELSDAIQTGAINVVQKVDCGESPRLGPTIYTPIQVNGTSTNALVDTGSPATIVSLKFVLEVLKRARTKDQTNQQWIDATQKRFQQWIDATQKRFTDPDVTLKSYGGFQLHFMAQIELSLARGNYQAEATALVKKDAPNDLLIGTDVQPKLGLALLVKEEDGRTIDLFSGQETTVYGTLPSQTALSQVQKECVVGPPTSGSDRDVNGSTSRWNCDFNKPVSEQVPASDFGG